MDLLELSLLCAARHTNKKSGIVDSGLKILSGTEDEKGLVVVAMKAIDDLVATGHLRREKGGYTLTESGRVAMDEGLTVTNRVQSALRYH